MTKVEVLEGFRAKDSSGKIFDIQGIEFNSRIFWSKADTGWEEKFKAVLTPGRILEKLRVWDETKLTVRI
jgi:hypothetical protein